jgi:hypothetical protein
MAVIEPTVASVRRPAAAVSGALTGTLLVRRANRLSLDLAPRPFSMDRT